MNVYLKHCCEIYDDQLSSEHYPMSCTSACYKQKKIPPFASVTLKNTQSEVSCFVSKRDFFWSKRRTRYTVYGYSQLLCLSVYQHRDKQIRNNYREVVFDLVVERAPFISGLKNLEEAILAFLYVCFVTNMEYPKVQVNNNLIYPLTVLFGLSSRWSFCLQCNENFFENPEPFDVFTDLQLFIPLFYTYFFIDI